MPASCHAVKEGLYSDPVCLPDGSYVLRSIGRCDPLTASFAWSFCGLTDGKGLEELHFNIFNGDCFVSSRVSSNSYCQNNVVTNRASKEKVIDTWLEVGTASMTSSGWVSVTTTSTTFSRASVFIGVPDLRGAGGEVGFHVSGRVRNVQTSVGGQVSFEAKLYLANDSYCSTEWYIPEPVGTDGSVEVMWLVAEHGAYDVSGSRFMISEGPIIRTDNVPSNDANRIDFYYPVGCDSPTESCSMGDESTLGVVMQLQTLVYDRLLIPRAYLLGSQHSRLVLQPHDSDDPDYYVMLDPETLAYIVYESGVSVSCADTSVSITSAFFPQARHFTFDMPFEDVSYESVPGVFASVTSCRSLRDSSSVRVQNLTTADVILSIQEDQCLDEEVRHTWEGMSVFVFGEASVVGDAVCHIAYAPRSHSPTGLPTASPTQVPTLPPVSGPTCVPSVSPTRPPTTEPTLSPTCSPTLTPTSRPSETPTARPSSAPTTPIPTVVPSSAPTPGPTAPPTPRPSASPTVFVPSDVVNLITKEKVIDTWLEVGTASMTSSGWVSVSTTSTTFSRASVFIGVPDLRGAGGEVGFHVSGRVHNIQTSVGGQVSFEAKLYLANDSYCSTEWYIPEPVGTDGSVEVMWLVAEHGAYDVSGSRLMISEGPIIRTDNVPSNDANRIDFYYPVGCDSPTESCSMGDESTLGVVMQLQTLVYDRLLIPRAYLLGSQHSRLVLQPHDSDDPDYYVMLDPETLAYIVYESGVSVSCADTSVSITSAFFPQARHFTFDMPFEDVSYESVPGVFASVTSCRSLRDSSSVRVQNLTTADVILSIQEDQCLDEEVRHTWEGMSVFVVGESSAVGDAVCHIAYAPRSHSPTGLPTASPTQVPTRQPTCAPTEVPTLRPTANPSETPTVSPTQSPTLPPVPGPTCVPSVSPTFPPTTDPTLSPTCFPTLTPTSRPSETPTARPSSAPTNPPTPIPTVVPSSAPTPGPTAPPTPRPSASPTVFVPSDVVNLITKEKVIDTWLEVGTASMTSSGWVSVSTTSTTFSRASVFIGVPDLRGAGGEVGFHVSGRVRNVQTSVGGQVSFEAKLYLANDSYCSTEWYIPEPVGTDGSVEVMWLVAEHGAYDVSGSRFMISEGPIIRTDNVPSNDANRIDFYYPVGCDSPTESCSMGDESTLGVVMQLQTLVYDRLLIPRAYLLGSQHSRLVLQPHDSDDPDYYVMLDPETLAYIVYESGVSVSCADTSVSITSAFFPQARHFTFDMPFEDVSYESVPGVFASVTSCRSLRDSSSVRVQNLTTADVILSIQEDQCLDEEVRHTWEGMSVFVFGEASVVGDAVCHIAYAPRSHSPTGLPTASPTQVPTRQPTCAPTEVPTLRPTANPSETPTVSPTQSPTLPPVPGPTCVPSVSPTFPPTTDPTLSPTCFPTLTPTSRPSETPTARPSSAPTNPPTPIPTVVPSSAPTPGPTAPPTPRPSASPTVFVPSDVVNLITKEKVIDTWLEVGTASMTSSGWVSVSTTSTTFSRASVFIGVPDLRGAGGEVGFHVSGRVRNVQTSVGGQVSFEAKLYLANDSYCSTEWYIPEPVGTDGSVEVMWLVAEHGAYDVSGSRFMISEGPIIRTDNVPSNDANRIDFYYPVGCDSPTESCSMGDESTLGVVMQLQTLVYDRLLIPRAYLLGSQHSRLVLQPHDSDDPDYYVMLDPETLAYIVYESGVSVSCADTSVSITSAFFPQARHFTFDMPFEDVSYESVPGVFASVTSCRSLRDSSSVRVQNLTTADVILSIQEDQCLDEEVRHTWEGMSVFVFGEASVVGDAVCHIAYAPRSHSPTGLPTASPTQVPTLPPVSGPTCVPSVSPTRPPTTEPTLSPTCSPTLTPTSRPSETPTARPSSAPTTPIPTVVPSSAPTPGPTAPPTPRPSASPTVFVPSDVVNLITKEKVIDTWLEVGTASMTSSGWVSVSTTSTTFSRASVFIGVPDLRGAGGEVGFHVSGRVRNVQTSVGGQVSFEAKLYLANDSYCSTEWYIPEPVGTDGSVEVMWLVAEHGAYDVSGSRFMISEGPIIRTDNVPSNDANRIDFYYPVGCDSPTESCSMGDESTLGVVMQLQTLVYDRLLIPRAYLLGSQHSRLVLQPHDSDDPDYYVMLDPETLAYIVYESGVSVSCADTSVSITSAFFPQARHFTFGMPFEDVSYESVPGVFASVTTCRSLRDSSSVRVQNLTTADVILSIQEDQCLDEEVRHTWEGMSVFVFGESSAVGDAVCHIALHGQSASIGRLVR